MAFRQNARSHPRVEHSNYTMLQAFEWYTEGGGTHWNRLKGMVKNLSEMGVSSLWLPPPTKGTAPESTGYDIYDLWDLGEFEQKGSRATRWGTVEELRELIAEASKEGISCYFDIVMNHRMGADEKETFKVVEVDPNDREAATSEPYDIEAWTKFNFSVRNNKYCDKKLNFNHFTGVDWDALGERSGIFKICGENKGWAQAVDSENGNYDFLMGCDLDHAHPDVAEEYYAWGTWLVKEFGVGGFRFDAVKHIDRNFVSNFTKEVRKRTGEEDLFCVGEFWKDDCDVISEYLTGLETQFSCFDAPLHSNFKEAGDVGNDYDMRQIFDGSVTQKRPIDSVTLVENHDTQAGQSLQAVVATYFKPIAYSMILLRIEGYPCVFYGDLYGTNGDQSQPPISGLKDIIRCRKLFAYGECHDYFDHANCLGWVRTGDEHHDGMAVVVCNGDGDGVKHMEIGSHKAGQVWTDVLNWHKDEVTIGEDGWADFKCPAKSLSIWAAKDAKFRNEFKN